MVMGRMLKRIRTSLAGTAFFKKAVDMGIFREKPSGKFLSGLCLMGFSYIIGWPLVSLLGVIAVYLRKPLIFAIGSPIVYIISHLVFLLGAWISGKDGIIYMKALSRWLFTKLCLKILGKDMIPAPGQTGGSSTVIRGERDGK